MVKYAEQYGHTTDVSPQAAARADVDLFEMAELRAIRELAQAVHKAGLQFDGWPRVNRIRMVRSPEGLIEADERHGARVDMWRVDARVLAVPRAMTCVHGHQLDDRSHRCGV